MLSLLFVDDETGVIKDIKISLEQTGEFYLDTALSVTDAMKKLETVSYDAVVSGHRMPDIDSVALVKYIRSRYGRLPFILFADTGTEETAGEALTRDADFYLMRQGDAKSQSAELEHLIRQVVIRRMEDERQAGVSFSGSPDHPGPKTVDDAFLGRAFRTDQNPDPVLEIDLNKEILSANPACITCLKNLHMPENPAAFFPQDIDAVIQSLTAGKIPVLYREVPVGDALFEESLGLSSDALTIRIFAHDITRWIRKVHALEQANRKMSRLTGIARHDIRNKLTGVLGYLELSIESTNDPSLTEYLRRAESSATAIRYQVDFTKDYENLGSNGPSWTDVSGVITDVKKRHGAISFTDQSAGISIYADPLLSQVLSGLVDNSLRHGGNVTGIRISGQMTPAGFILVYEDDGVGIPEDKKEKIFNRVADKRSGVGLFLAREILSITGITIKENGTPGRGARFEITVPKNGYRIDQEKILS